MRKITLLAAAVVVAAIALTGAWLMLRPAPSVELSEAMMNVAGVEIGGPFELTAQSGERMTSDQVIDRPALVYFGYTYCPDICPIDVQLIADVVDLLATRGIAVRPVFITIDPARDTAEELADYAESMHPEMIALTGTEDEIRATANAYKVFYQKVELPGSAAEYAMQHSGFTYLVVPGHGTVAIFRREFPAELIADDVARVLAAL